MFRHLGGALVLGLGLVSSAVAEDSVWSYAGKTGIGTAYTPYQGGQFVKAPSKVWYSISKGIVTETMYGLIHQAQVKEMQFAVKTEAGMRLESQDLVSQTSYLHVDARGRPQSLAYRVVSRDRGGHFLLEKHIFSDPDRNSLFVRVTLTPLKGKITPYLILEPHMNNTGGNDRAEVSHDELTAHEDGVFLSLKGSRPFVAETVDPLGQDGLFALMNQGALGPLRAKIDKDTAGIRIVAQLPEQTKPLTYDFVIGFGQSADESRTAAERTLKTGYDQVLSNFKGYVGHQGQSRHQGWSTYLQSLKDLPRVAAQATDGGKLAYASALVLKAHEDKTYAGALIASLSNPWGDTVSAEKPSTGYKAVWPRDFYQTAMAMAAVGDTKTPLAAFRYLKTVQVRPETPGNTGVSGWFQQKSEVDGTPEWVGVQLDQTAMPIMLGYRLWKSGLLSTAELKARYGDMLKPAADFLVRGGQVGLGWNHQALTPPFTQQERWEEQAGYSPSTTAAVVTGLVIAAELAEAVGDKDGAVTYRHQADAYVQKIEPLMVTTKGALSTSPYYMRLTPKSDPNTHDLIPTANGRPALEADKMVDAGFLELVRYGVRAAKDPLIVSSLKVIDDQSLSPDLRVRYDFVLKGSKIKVPGFRRYGNDGYGDDAITGGNYGEAGLMSKGQRGRVWPIFTGERGHYALALALEQGGPSARDLKTLRLTYVRGMEGFANQGLMLPEQVWDGVGTNSRHVYKIGQGTDSATPLAWAHAEYLKLLRSLADQRVYDRYEPVRAKYAH